MKSSKIILPALLAAALVGATTYTAQAAGMDGKKGMMEGCGMKSGGMMGEMMGAGAVMPGMVKHIKGQLKPEQVAQFDAALKDYSKKIEPMQQSLFVKHQELKALQNATNPDVKAVGKTATELAQLFSKLKAEREAFDEKIKKDFGVKDMDMMGCGMMGGMKHGDMGGMKHGDMGDMKHGDMGGMKQDGMGQAPAAANQAPAGHEGHKQ